MKRATVVTIIGLLVVISTAVNLSFSLRIGSLSRPPIYDDVVYLLDAYQRLAFGGVDSPAALVGSFLSDPPHAPMSTLTAMLGYSLVGPSVWAAYAASIWLLAIFAAATYFVARRNVDQVSSIAITALMLFVPAAHALITEFRPDMGAGVILACALLCLLLTDYAKATKLQLLALALLVVCSIMAKLSAIVATLPILGIAALFGIIRPGLYAKSEMAASARAAIFPLAITTALLIPCVVVWGPNTYAYVYQALVTNIDVWAPNEGPFYHWMFNSFGHGGKLALSAFLWLGLLSIALDVCLSLTLRYKRDSYGAVAFYFVVVLLYCGIAVSPQKSAYQGSLFHFPFLLATTLALGRNLSRIGGHTQRIVPAILLAAATIFMPGASFYQDYPAYRDSGPVLASVSDAIASEVSSLRSKGCKANSFMLASMNPYPVTIEAVALFLAMNRRIHIKPLELYFIRSVEQMDRAVHAADFIILYKGKEEVPNLPGSKFGSQTSVRLASDGNWHLISSTSEYELFAKTECGPKADAMPPSQRRFASLAPDLIG